jgi:ATP-dependent DNA helicase 2 subunit 1
MGHKRIFLFTNDDDPNATSQHLREQSIQRAKDLAELGIEIELFSMNRVGHPFDPLKFYQVNNYLSFFYRHLIFVPNQSNK